MSKEYEELREKVARAIGKAMLEGKPTSTIAVDALRVVAEAMQEPSEAMLNAGDTARVYREDSPDDTWEARANTRNTWEQMLAAHPLAEALRDE